MLRGYMLERAREGVSGLRLTSQRDKDTMGTTAKARWNGGDSLYFVEVKLYSYLLAVE